MVFYFFTPVQLRHLLYNGDCLAKSAGWSFQPRKWWNMGTQCFAGEITYLFDCADHTLSAPYRLPRAVPLLGMYVASPKCTSTRFVAGGLTIPSLSRLWFSYVNLVSLGLPFAGTLIRNYCFMVNLLFDSRLFIFPSFVLCEQMLWWGSSQNLSP